MKKKILSGLFLLAFLACTFMGCNNKTGKEVVEISIDFSAIKSIDLSNVPMVNLQFTDNSMIKRVDELILHDDKYFFVRSGHDLFVFDHEGMFKNQVGRKGNGPMEFTHFNSFFIKDSTVFIYDAMARKINSYEFNGQYLNSFSLKDTYERILPNYIYPVNNDQFISKNTFGGDESKIPSYSILNKDYTIISSSTNRYLKDGITTMNNFFSNNKYILFWELLNDTIFSVTNNDAYLPKYHVNFNEKSFPNSIKKLDIYDVIEFSNKPESKRKYASLIRSVSEDESYLRFLFFFNGNVHYVKYNKEERQARTYKFVCGSKTVEALMLLHKDSIIVPIDHLEDFSNPSLAIINDNLL